MTQDAEFGLGNSEFKSKFPGKKIFSFIGLIILIIGVVTSVYLVQNQKIFKSRAAELFGAQEVQPQLKQETTLIDIAVEGHPQLFYADLEYDPATGLVTQQAIEKTQGDLEGFYLDPPGSLPQYFIFKVIVVKDGTTITYGWDTILEELARTPQNTLEFQVITSYSENSVVYVYLEDSPGSWNKLIWSGRME